MNVRARLERTEMDQDVEAVDVRLVSKFHDMYTHDALGRCSGFWF